jgi:polyphenol oxidase
MSRIDSIKPEWAAPNTVHAAFTLRSGGVSVGPFESFNLGLHVGDDPLAVEENRRRLRAELSLSKEPMWLEQVHGTNVLDLDASTVDAPLHGDAAVARTARSVCVIQVADCMPVLFAARSGEAIGAAHAGWRGLANGVLEATVQAMNVEPSRLVAWLGPAIGPANFEVGDEVRAAFVSRDGQADAAFKKNPRGRWQCDLYALARLRLAALGLRSVTGGKWCTYADSQRFFSYRRDGSCGRMAALIWLATPADTA